MLVATSLMVAGVLLCQPTRAETGEQHCQAASPACQARVAATVNGRPILEEDVIQTARPQVQKLERLPEPERSERTKTARNNALEQVIDLELLYQDAMSHLSRGNPKALKKLKEVWKQEIISGLKDKHGFSDEELKDWLRQQGTSVEGMEPRQWRKRLADEYLRSRLFPLLRDKDQAQSAEITERETRRIIRDLRSRAVIEIASTWSTQNT